MKLVDTNSYCNEVKMSLVNTDMNIHSVVYAINELRKNGKTLWILGNGGSLAIAQHFAQDLLKMRGVKAQALTCPSVITAFTNDVDFEHSFYGSLKVLYEPGDVIMIFSCSGSSRNYTKIVNEKMRPIISVVGTGGGFLKQNSDISIHVQHESYQVCETAFSVVADLILSGLEEKE